uniref:MULE domain-containing protein n=1 Tax=Caenorhabditis tropicalis TaxID=1561998 RepID=A0A1I7T801_9PELO
MCVTRPNMRTVRRKNIRLPCPSTHEPQNLPLAVLDVLINGIVDGNETHEKAVELRKRGFSGMLKKKHLEEIASVESVSMFQFFKKPQRDTFTVPEAIHVQRPELHEVDYRCYSGDFISNLVTAITMPVTSPYLCEIDRLSFGVLAYERAMCFIYDRPTHSILLLDTHMHFKGRAGSVLCVASFENITDFIVAVTKLVFHEVFRTSDFTGQFEITCLMLTSLMNKVYKGSIFVPIKQKTTRLPSSKPLRPIRIKPR